MKITLEQKKVYEFLNMLRDSGVTNMFGAAPYVEKHFGFDIKKSRTLLSGWMEDFNPDGYDDCEII